MTCLLSFPSFRESALPYGGDAVLEDEPVSKPNWNQRQAIDARERIRSGMARLRETGALPTTVRGRNTALRQFGISSKTLYKNVDLWHPEVLRETPEPLPDKVIYPVGSDQTHERLLQPPSDELIYPMAAISLSPSSDLVPQAQRSDRSEKRAVGESEGFSTAEPPAPEGAAAVKRLIDRIAQQTERRRLTPPPDETIPDEHYFQQLEVALWRE